MEKAETMLENEPQMTEPEIQEALAPEPDEGSKPEAEPASEEAEEAQDGETGPEEVIAELEQADEAALLEEGAVQPENRLGAEIAEPAVMEPEVEEEAPPGPGESLTGEELVAAISALIFASPEPLGTGRLIKLLEGPARARVQAALIEVAELMSKSGLPLELREIAGGWRMMTTPEQGDNVARLVKARKTDKLSPAGLETLAVVAYRQPVTKADIEAIRGVQCGAMLRNLVDRGLARVTGRADVPGGPLEYGTTKEFLDRFGMGSLKDLPRDGELLKE